MDYYLKDFSDNLVLHPWDEMTPKDFAEFDAWNDYLDLLAIEQQESQFQPYSTH